MARFEIDPERTRLEVATRPGMPGLGARVSDVEGAFEVGVDDAGAIDLTLPVRGSFSLVVSEVQTGNQLVAAAVGRWLTADTLAMTGSIDEVRPTEPNRFDVAMTVTDRERSVNLVANARLGMIDHEHLEASGVTMCDPRAFGISLPPLLNLIVHVRWRLTLVPTWH